MNTLSMAVPDADILAVASLLYVVAEQYILE